VLVVAFTWTIEDHLALDRHRDRETDAGREERRRRSVTTVAAVGLLLATFVVLAHKDMGPVAFLLVAVAIPLVGLAMHALQEADLARRRRKLVARLVRDAADRATRGRGRDPLPKCKVILGPFGVSFDSPHESLSSSWSEFSRVVVCDGYIFFHRPADRDRDQTVEHLIPARAFGDVVAARDTFGRIAAWHESAR
jgi:hypothetical protein